MLAIAWSLLGGWILSLFGFKGVVIAGMAQVFGVTLNTLGYYFLFGMFGALRRVATLVGAVGKKRETNTTMNPFADLGKSMEKFNQTLNKKK